MTYKSILSGLVISSMIILIFSFSLQDAPTSNALSTNVTESLIQLTQPILDSSSLTLSSINSIVRDLGHFTLFFLLGFITLLAFLYQGLSFKQSAWTTLILGLCIALIDECLQLTSPGRAFELIDLGKDILGLCTSITLLFTLVVWNRNT